MAGDWLKLFGSRTRAPFETPPAERVRVDLSSPAAALRTMAQAYINGDGTALLECVELNDSSWPRGRMQGWATFVDAAGRLRRAADTAFGPGSGDQLIRDILIRDPKEHGTQMLGLLDAGGYRHLDNSETPAPTPAPAPESFVLGSTWLVQTAAGWKLTGGPSHSTAPRSIDPELLREAMDHSDRAVVADAETAYFLADGIETGRLASMSKVRSVGEKERDRARQRAGWNDRKFNKRLLAAADKTTG